LNVTVQLRPVVADDTNACGRICFAAFAAVADQHNFPRNYPSVEAACDVIRMVIEHTGFYGVVAEDDGRVLGSNFMYERSAVAGIGPVTVDPAAQNLGVGRRLMQDVLDRAAARHAPSARLVQAAYNNRSLSLYTKLGFCTREPLSLMQGSPLAIAFPGYTVRPAEPADLEQCNALCQQVHGFDRGGELRDAISQKSAAVVVHLGRITGYTTTVGFLGHTVATADQDLMALIAAAPNFPGPGFLVPTRNHRVFSWCLNNGLRVVLPMMLMSIGLYNEPAGAWLPSIIY
jgi:predicted N-acetyltransferase YhbS